MSLKHWISAQGLNLLNHSNFNAFDSPISCICLEIAFHSLHFKNLYIEIRIFRYPGYSKNLLVMHFKQQNLQRGGFQKKKECICYHGSITTKNLIKNRNELPLIRQFRVFNASRSQFEFSLCSSSSSNSIQKKVKIICRLFNTVVDVSNSRNEDLRKREIRHLFSSAETKFCQNNSSACLITRRETHWCKFTNFVE